MAKRATAEQAPITPTAPLVPARAWGSFTGWTLESIRNARDAHMGGNMQVSADLAQAAKCEPTIFTALQNRVAPHRGLPRVVRSSKTRIAKEASATFSPSGPALPASTVATAMERMIMLGAGVSQNVWSPRKDGSRVDIRTELWPARSLRVDTARNQLQAVTTTGFVDVVHGDGRWVVWALFADEPWQWGAVKPLSTLWAQLSMGGADWQEASEIHGHAHTIGTLPDGMAADSEAAKAFGLICDELTSRKRSGGVIPGGAKVELVEANSNVWQIWSELIKQRTSEVVRTLLGQDGTTTNTGGNYIKAAQLAGVRDDLVEADLGAGGYAATTGILLPWAAVNFGADAAPDLDLAWLFPDREEDMRRQSLATREKAYTEGIIARRAAGFIVTQAWADAYADELGVARAELRDPSGIEPAPVVAAAPPDPAFGDEPAA